MTIYLTRSLKDGVHTYRHVVMKLANVVLCYFQVGYFGEKFKYLPNVFIRHTSLS